MTYSSDRFVNNRYRIVRELGRGGMGLIYLVADILKDDMLFALKTIKQDILHNCRKAGIETFKNEYEIMTRLKHPNLTRVYEFGEDDDNYYIVMEYLRGELIRDCQISTLHSKFDIMVQILRAMEYIHSRNIIYRDIKPNNIIYHNGMIKLLDFGLSWPAESEDDAVRGTLSYISPEILKGRISYSADIFSLGITFFEIITGKRFYNLDKPGLISVISLLREEENFNSFARNRLALLNPGLLRGIIKKMISYNPSRRYSCCSEIIADINDRLDYKFELETRETKKSYVLGNPFSNRKKELLTLTGNLSNGKLGHFVVFSGPSGVGKTRLFNEFKKYCRLNDISFFETSCMEGGIRDYYSICEILSQMLTFACDDLVDRFGRHLKIILPHHKRLSEYKKTEFPDNPKLVREIIIQNVTDFIIDFSNSEKYCTIIYFNDIQWIDEGTAHILRSIIYLTGLYGDRARNLYIYSNHSQNRAARYSGINSLFAMKGTAYAVLSPLDNEGVSEYLENIFGSKFIDSSIREAIPDIKERIGGNPLLLGEFIQSLIERDFIAKGKRYWKLHRPLSDAKMPKNIIDIIKGKTELLFKDGKKKLILQVLSLLRVDLDVDAIKGFIERLMDVDSAGVLQELENLEIIQSERKDNKILYSYASSLIKDYIRKSIPGNKRAYICAVLSDNLEVIPGADDYAEEIAYHYQESGGIEKAMVWYEKSGDIARANFFNEKAISCYEKVLGLLKQSRTKSPEKEIRIKLILGELLDLTGRLIESEKIYRQCLNSASLIKNKKLRGDSLLKYGRLRFIRGEYKRAVIAYNKAMRIYAESSDKSGLGNAIRSKGHVYFTQGKYAKALECYTMFRDISAETGNKINLGLAYGNMGSVFFKMNKYLKSLECHHFSRETAEDAGSKLGIAMSMGNMGNVYNKLGEYEKALECHKKHLSIAEETGDKQGIAVASGNMGVVLGNLARYAESVQAYEKCRQIFIETGNRYGIGISNANIGFIYFTLGDFIKALKHYREYRQISREIKDRLGCANSDWFTGAVYFELGDYDQSLEFLERAEKAFISLRVFSSESMSCLYTKAWVLHKKGFIEKALMANQISKDIAEKISDKSMILYTEIQRHVILAAYDGKGSAKALERLLKDSRHDTETADIIYELFFITHKNEYRSTALKIFKSLYKEIPKYEYKKKIERLERKK